MTEAKSPSEKITCIGISAPQPHSPGTFSVGTGFLVKREDGTISLVTAAHVPGTEAFNDFVNWPQSMTAHINTNHNLTINLFRIVDGQRKTIFEHIVTPSGEMTNAIAIRIPSDLIASGGRLERFHVYSTATSPRPSAKEPFEIHGYPKWRSEPSVQPAELVKKGGSYRQYNEAGFHEAIIPADKGHSGGPAMDERGQLLGMVIGQTYGIDRIVSVDLINVLIAD